MTRRHHVSRNLDGSITLVIDSVVYRMTEAEFIAFMEQALNTLQALTACKHKPPSE